jgi:hypothetical protein
MLIFPSAERGFGTLKSKWGFEHNVAIRFKKLTINIVSNYSGILFPICPFCPFHIYVYVSSPNEILALLSTTSTSLF